MDVGDRVYSIDEMLMVEIDGGKERQVKILPESVGKIVEVVSKDMLVMVQFERIFVNDRPFKRNDIIDTVIRLTKALGADDGDHLKEDIKDTNLLFTFPVPTMNLTCDADYCDEVYGSTNYGAQGVSGVSADGDLLYGGEKID